MRITESRLRRIVRHEILREYTLGMALMSGPEQIFDAIVGLFKDAVAPTEQERLRETGDDRLIDEYQRFLGTLHLTPEYRMVWENYKQAQRNHASDDPEWDRARAIRSPVGIAFSKLKGRVLYRLDELERNLSLKNMDIWQDDIEEQRKIFTKMFYDWEGRRLTTGRVLGLLDPAGIVEGRKKSGATLVESDEMFWGKDLEARKRSDLQAVLDDVLMDLEEANCPDVDVFVAVEGAIDFIERFDPELEEDASQEVADVVGGAISAVENCPHIESVSGMIAMKMSDAVDKYMKTTRF